MNQKLVVTLKLKIPPHLINVVTLPCEMSDVALSPATTMTNCMINVDWAWHVASKQPELKFHQLCCFGGSFINGLSMLTIHDNSGVRLTKRCDSLLCRSVWLIAPLVSGVAGFSASYSSKADTLNIWCVNGDVTVTLDNNWDNKQVVLLLIFLECFVTDIALFSTVALKTLIFH